MDFDFGSLGDFFDATEDCFDKRFREDNLFRLSVTSVSENEDESELKFSPRLTLLKDGSATGKVKFGYTTSVGPCELYQRVAVDHEGTISAKIDCEGEVPDTEHELSASAALTINTVNPPAEDNFGVSVGYSRSDSYFEASMEKASGGDGSVGLAAGIKAFNGIAGVEASRDLDGESTFAGGLGFSGDDFAVAAKVCRTSEQWTGANVCIMRQERRMLAVAQFDLDLLEDVQPTKITFALEHGMRLRLPSWIRESPLRLTAGAKLDTVGTMVGKVSTVLKGLRYSFVAKRENGGAPSFGLNVRYE